MKKFACIILSLTLALSMVACGDTAPVQTDNTEDTLTSEGLGEIGGTEVIENTDVHCDFDTLVMNYMEVEGLDEMGDDELFLFYKYLYTQGIKPDFDCDNEYYAGYKAYWDKYNQPDVEPTPVKSAEDGGCVINDNGTVTFPHRQYTAPQSEMKGTYVPMDEVLSYVYENMGADTYALVEEYSRVSPDALAEVQWQIYYKDADTAKKSLDKKLPSYIAVATNKGSQSSDNAY